MIQANTNMSALEWFFRNKPSASNFPQDSSSPELRQLCKMLKQLSIVLGSQQAIELTEFSDFFAEWVDQVGAVERIEKSRVDNLILKIEELIALVKSSNDYLEIVKHLKATVIPLVILAKTSRDVDFRNKIIQLAKALDA